MPRPGRKVDRNIKAGVPAAEQRIDIQTLKDFPSIMDSPIMAMSPAAVAMSAAAVMSSPAAAMSVMSCRREMWDSPGSRGRRGWLQHRQDTRYRCKTTCCDGIMTGGEREGICGGKLLNVSFP